MRIDTLYDELERIVKIEDPEETQRELQKLYKKLNSPKWTAVTRGNWTYFYNYEIKYDPEAQRTRRANRKSIGKLPKEVYNNNKKQIKKMNYNQLIEYLNKERL
jgi:hypothetical protein